MRDKFKTPCIIKDTTNAVLIMNDGFGYHLHGEFHGEISDKKYYIDSGCKNITSEYLQNTYGKVQSPEHAEFIIELAVNAGIDFDPSNSDSHPRWFVFIDDELYFIGVDRFTSENRKQITIPLLSKADKQEVSEWPKIGDEVCWSNGCYKGVVKARHYNDLWVMESDGEFSTLYIDDISKPKTPEEELRDELAEWIDRNNDVWKGENHYEPVSTTIHEFIAGAIMMKYNITKKA